MELLWILRLDRSLLTNWRAFFKLGGATQIGVARLGMNADNKKAKANASKNKKTRLIRLDDLIPKKNVVGGRQLPFGATYTQQTNQNKV